MQTHFKVGTAFGQSFTADQLMTDSSTKRTSRITPKGSAPGKIVFLFDVDNTLLDNDQVISDLRQQLEKEVGSEGAQSYWNIFEQLRVSSVMRYLGALQRYYRDNTPTICVSSPFPVF
jgi:hypothetical protein